MNNYSELFKGLLKKHGLKYTTQRRIILNVLVEHEGQHFCSEEIYEIVKQRYPEIGLATIYRTMILLERFGIVYKVDVDDVRSRYALALDNSENNEQSLICTKCGEILDIRKNTVTKFEREVLKYHAFTINTHKIKLYGFCKKCL